METGNTIMLDSSGDIVINGKNRVPTISGISKSAQDLTVILKSAVGSLASAPSFGTDIMGIANANRDASIIEGVIRSALVSYRYTKYVDSVSVDASGKTLVINATVVLSDDSTVRVEAEI